MSKPLNAFFEAHDGVIILFVSGYEANMSKLFFEFCKTHVGHNKKIKRLVAYRKQWCSTVVDFQWM